ncbi:SPATS2-like protein [Pelodytes ibericus]
MEQANQNKTMKEKFQKHRRGKPNYVGAYSENKQTVTRKTESRLTPAPLNKEVIRQDLVKGEGEIKQGVEKNVIGKEVKVYSEIPGLNFEKSAKDLQRCSVSITRYRQMIKEEVENSVKNIKSSFAELYKSIVEREVQLMLEVERVKEEALENLMSRQTIAEELRRTAELSSHRTDAEVSDIRTQIKHFVSERKYDEELTKSARISLEAEQLRQQILLCGEISHPKNGYTTRTPSSTILFSEVQSVSSAKPNNGQQRMKKTSTHSKSKPSIKHVEDTETPGSNIPPASQASFNKLPRSYEQHVDHAAHRRFVPKRMGFQSKAKYSMSDDGTSHDFNPTPKCEALRGPKNSFRGRNRRSTSSKDHLISQNKTLEHAECIPDSKQSKTDKAHLKGSAGHIT